MDLPVRSAEPREGKSAQRRSRASQIHAALLAAILGHRLPPGTRLPEDEVGALFGASRTIARAALQALAHDRLVTIVPNRGAQVAEPTVVEARQVFEARSLIEPRVAMLATDRAKPADIARLNRHLKDEAAAVARDDPGRAIALSAEFHNSIAALADQAILAAFVRELTSRSSLVVALYWRRRDAICERHAHHELVEAIAGKDGERAADLMRSHLVDILSGLDLTQKTKQGGSLSDLMQDQSIRR